MTQTKWKCVAQLGDASPIEHGGYWVFIDEAGISDPQAELWNPAAEGSRFGESHRFSLPRCTFINWVLSDNKYHPDKPAWFAADIDHIARFAGFMESALRDALCGDNPVNRAIAYRAISDYRGPFNFDAYPLELTAAEARRRYKAKKYRVIEAGKAGE